MEISPKDKIFAQFIPEGKLPIGFFITEELRFSAPTGCEVYLLRDGVAVVARDFVTPDLSMRLITQKRENDLLVSVFVHGSLQVSLESSDGFFTATLPHSFERCELFFQDEFALLKSPTALAVFHRSGKQVLSENILSYTLDGNVLTAILPLFDHLQSTAECSWILEQGECKRISFTIRREQNGKPIDVLQAELLPYAFLESVLIGANFEEMLCDDLLPKKDKIRDFLGEFTAVTLTENPNVCGLVRQKGERLFEVDYFTIEQKDGKITDVRG